MEPNEALEVLGLTDGVLERDVDKAFRKLARDMHPDHGASRATWDKLQEARDVAAKFCCAASSEPSRGDLVQRPGTDLEPRSPEDIAISTERELTRLRRGEEAKNIRRSVLRRRTSKLTAAKRRAWLMAGLGAVGAAFVQLFKVLRPASSTSRLTIAREHSYDRITLNAVVAVTLVGLLGVVCKLRADSIGHAVEDFTTELADHGTHLPLLDELVRESADDSLIAPGRWWTRGDLEEHVDRWSRRPPRTSFFPDPSLILRDTSPSLANLARRIGVPDAARLIIAKMLEAGTLAEHLNENGNRVTLYAWVQQPGASDFEPQSIG